MLFSSVWPYLFSLLYAFILRCTLLLSVHPLIQFLFSFFSFYPILFCHHHSSCACISSLYHFSSLFLRNPFLFSRGVLTFSFLFLLRSEAMAMGESEPAVEGSNKGRSVAVRPVVVYVYESSLPPYEARTICVLEDYERNRLPSSFYLPLHPQDYDREFQLVAFLSLLSWPSSPCFDHHSNCIHFFLSFECCFVWEQAVNFFLDLSPTTTSSNRSSFEFEKTAPSHCL